ncbi:MAG: hypothetical protein BWY56_01291 [Acidobacteria bacterium ADurb.Bin340]|nr:MAG: hypothetical protein BWY56_01291 [Acidobacteria bacterium ADurb.Bin340]
MVAASAVEVATAAGGSACLPHPLGHEGQIHSLEGFAGTLRPFHVLEHRGARTGGDLLVGAGGVVAHETVHLLRLGEIEAGVLPSVARVAAGAAGLIGGQGQAEVVDRVLLAEIHRLPVSGLGGRPSPMDGLHEVLRVLLMACQAGPRDFGAGLEGTFHMVGMAGLVGGGHPSANEQGETRGQRADEPGGRHGTSRGTGGSMGTPRRGGQSHGETVFLVVNNLIR